ncbi:type IX secretion system anionic LPS delivery protein PorZ, partial [Marinilabilia sp.]
YVRTWGMAFDDNGHLYITNGEYVDPIVVYDVEDDAWYSYSYGILTSDYNKVGQLLIDNNGYKWCYTMRGPAKGIWVFDDNGTIENQWDDQYRGSISPANDSDSRNVGALQLWDENGEPLTDNIFSLAKDENGYIWIGTDIGVLVQYDPANVFNIDKPSFIRIKVPRNDGSGLADYLLENQRVTSIAIDGANRKYFGTDGSGLYLISEDGTKTIEHFTTVNSPLPSDNIRDIEIDPQSGEIYISTDAGLISYQGDATSGSTAFNEVYVYPNPVRPDYQGAVTISGLVDRTNVKITDTAGNLVYETISLGGNALWNGKNLYGEQVKPGVYIVFLASPDGTQTAQTKIAFIR